MLVSIHKGQVAGRTQPHNPALVRTSDIEFGEEKLLLPPARLHPHRKPPVQDIDRKSWIDCPSSSSVLCKPPRPERHRLRKLNTAMEGSLRVLAAVATCSNGLIPFLDGNARSVSLARRVSTVFKVYERRVRELGVPPDMHGLTNAQCDLVDQIFRRAKNALNVLETGSNGDACLALERAYSNGGTIETHLNELVQSICAASRSHLAMADSSGIHAQPAFLRTQLTDPHVGEVYHAANVVPPLPDNVYLDFNSRCENGKTCAPEANLKSKLLNITSSNRIIAARGAEMPEIVHGASGMTGVGKTTALIALGHDRDVQDHFKDDVLYVSLGADASVEHITRGLCKIMKFTGARGSADAVRKQKDLTVAVEDAAMWFLGKRNLFLIDDVWRTKNCEKGYLPQLRNILEGSPESRLVLTTRNVLIGSSGGSHVDFDARDPLGPTSTSMFLGYATRGCRLNAGVKHEALASVQGILGLCAGLPIALAATGGFVAVRVSLGYSFKSVCDMYLKDVEEKPNLGATILEHAINLSLECLNSELKTMSALSSQYTMREMYTSFCIMRRQQCVPIAVLGRMWDVDEKSAECIAELFSSMSLGKTAAVENLDGKREVEIRIHDLHLDYCCQQAHDEYGKKEWHFRLLKGHMPSFSGAMFEDVVFSLGHKNFSNASQGRGTK